MLHLNTPRPVLELANSQPQRERACHLARNVLNVLWPFDGRRLDGLRAIKGECSSVGLAPVMVVESLKVTGLLMRSPVLGRMRVAWRIYSLLVSLTCVRGCIQLSEDIQLVLTDDCPV